MKTRKSGFTLVELLIVIMIIAILAGMMMIATGSATDSAEAAKIINNLRNLKSAALLYYGDNLKWPTTASDVVSLDKYTDRAMSSVTTIGAGYTVDGLTRYNIGLNIADADPNVKAKLKDKAADTGLLGAATTTSAYNGEDTVWMIMR